ELTVLTYNLLFDLYEPEKLATEVRVPALLAHIREANADLLILVEVTASLLTHVLADAFIRANYWVSELPDGSTIAPYGQVILARAPMQVHEYLIRGHKRLIAAEVSLGGLSLLAVAVHLTSNRAEHAQAIRAGEFETLCTWLEDLPNHAATLVAGDFNVDADELDEAFESAGFVDLWPAVYPQDPGYTFDPNLNTLAAYSSRTQRPRRLDRCLLRDPGGHLTPIDVARIGTQPLPETVPGAIHPLYPSDHYGLWGLLQVQEQAQAPALATVPPTHHCAVVLLPPESMWPSIQAVRTAHDRHHPRWMPHITLLYPFVPREHLVQAARQLAELVEEVKPFEVTLAEAKQFVHTRSRTAYLAPTSAPKKALCDLQAHLLSEFPLCNPSPDNGPFTPHLTLGQLAKNPQQVGEQLRAWQALACPEPRTFEVAQVAIITRTADTPFEIVARIPFNTPTPTYTPPTAHTELLATLERSCIDILFGGICPPGARVCHAVGSTRLGVASSRSDLDVVLTAPAWLSPEHVLPQIREALVAAGLEVRTRSEATQALRLTVDGTDLDIQYAQWPSGIPLCPPAQLRPKQRATMAKGDLRALQAILDADTLITYVGKRVAVSSFLAALKWLRAWAHARGIYGNARTYPGGFAWALMLAACLPPAESSPANVTALDLLATCFHELVSREFLLPFMLDSEQPCPPDRAPIHVWTPTLPAVNATRNSTRSTKHVLVAECRRASEWILQKQGLAAACQAADPWDHRGPVLG
ncbi:MAG: poly(A) polymerase, partial [Nannocystaceae bacterium]